MKRIMISLCLLAITSPAVAANSTASCGAMDQIRNQARKSMEDVSQQVHDEYVVQKDESFWDDCIGNILDGGSSFGLKLPSVGSIMQNACSYAKDGIQDQLRQASQEFSYDFGHGVSVDASGTVTEGGGNQVTIDTNSSKTLADDVWSALQ